MTEHVCAVCGKPPTAQLGTLGALILYRTTDGGEDWFHRTCAERQLWAVKVKA